MLISNMAKIVAVVVILGAARASVFAADIEGDRIKQEALENVVQNYLAGTVQLIPGIGTNVNIATGDFLVSAPSVAETYLGSILWSVTLEEYNKDGAWLVQYMDRLIAIKPGFLRGTPTGGVYPTEPVAMISDITDIAYGNVRYAPYEFPGAKVCYLTSSGASLYFTFTTKKLTVNKCVNGQPDASFKKEIAYADWVNIWAKNASTYCGKNIPNYCFIPQRLVQEENYGDISRVTARYGYVASLGSPMSGPGGNPADFMELYKYNQQDGMDFALKKFSPSLNLLFKYAPQDSKLAWDIYGGVRGGEISDNAVEWQPEKHRAPPPENNVLQSIVGTLPADYITVNR